MFKTLSAAALAVTLSVGAVATAQAAPLDLPAEFQVGPSLLGSPLDVGIAGDGTGFAVLPNDTSANLFVTGLSIPVTSEGDITLNIFDAVTFDTFDGELFNTALGSGYGFEDNTVSFVFEANAGGATGAFADPDLLLLTLTSDDIAPLIGALSGSPVGTDPFGGTFFGIDGELDLFSITTEPSSPVPAPGPVLLLLTGLIGLGALRRRKAS